jgi:MFS family permease
MKIDADKSGRLPWLTIAALLLAVFIDSTSYSLAIPVLQPALLSETQEPIFLPGTSYQLRSQVYGVLMGVHPLLMLYMAPLLGSLSDQVGRRKVLILCTGGVLLGCVLQGVSLQVGWVWLTLLGRIVAGATAASQAVAQAALVDLSTPRNKPLLLSASLLASSLGFVFGPVIAAVFSDRTLVAWFDLAVPQFVNAALALLGVVLLLAFVHDRQTKFQSFDLRLLWPTHAFREFKQAYDDRVVRLLVLCFLIMQISWGAYFMFAATYLSGPMQYTQQQVSIFMSLLGVGFCLAYGVAQPLLIRVLSLRVLTLIGLGLTALVMPLTMASAAAPSEYAVAIVSGATVSIAFASFVTMLSNAVPADRQGWVLGIVGSTAALSWGIASGLAGVLNGFSPAWPILLSTILMALSALGMVLYGAPAAAVPDPSLKGAAE